GIFTLVLLGSIALVSGRSAGSSSVRGEVEFLGKAGPKMTFLAQTQASVASVVDETTALKQLPARGPLLSQPAKDKLKDGATRDALTAWLLEKKLCPSITHLNLERYEEVGRIDENMALRAMSLGLEIILRNYARYENLTQFYNYPPSQLAIE